MSPAPVVLKDISSRAWEHPADRAALQSLRRVPGFDLALRKVFGLISERALRLITQGSAVEVGPHQYAHLHKMYEDILVTLDAPRRYSLYVSQNPVVNAGAVGMDDPFIVLNSGTVQLLSDDQLRVVIAHEVGHIMSEHVLYKTMLRLLIRLTRLTVTVPMTGLALLAVVAALMEWDRKSELSADRAALLAVQEPELVRASLLRIAGGLGRGASVEAFQDQARQYEEGGSAFDSVVKTLALLNRTHPFPVQRMAELDRWIEAGDYDRVLAGEYPHRQDDPEEGAWKAWKESAQSYREGFRASADPLHKWMRETRHAAGDRLGSMMSWFRKEDEEQKPDGEGAPGDAAPGPDGDGPEPHGPDEGPPDIIDVEPE